MDRTIRYLYTYIDELRDTLLIECSKEEAYKYGTIKEWKTINNSINRLEHKVKRLQKQTTERNYDFLDNILDVLLLCLPIFFLVVEHVCTFGLVCLAVYYISHWLGVEFSLLFATILWLLFSIVFWACVKSPAASDLMIRCGGILYDEEKPN